ncbi:hypothetical protein Tco_1065996 [Tanacetum coccineum]
MASSRGRTDEGLSFTRRKQVMLLPSSRLLPSWSLISLHYTSDYHVLLCFGDLAEVVEMGAGHVAVV